MLAKPPILYMCSDRQPANTAASHSLPLPTQQRERMTGIFQAITEDVFSKRAHFQRDVIGIKTPIPSVSSCVFLNRLSVDWNALRTFVFVLILSLTKRVYKLMQGKVTQHRPKSIRFCSIQVLCPRAFRLLSKSAIEAQCGVKKCVIRLLLPGVSAQYFQYIKTYP